MLKFLDEAADEDDGPQQRLEAERPEQARAEAERVQAEQERARAERFEARWGRSGRIARGGSGGDPPP